MCIYGAGGSGQETLSCFIDTIPERRENISDLACFMVDDSYFETDTLMGIEVLRKSNVNINNYEVVVAIGNPILRRKMVESLPLNTKFRTIIHPSVIKTEWVEIGEGSIITAGCILTCNIKLGKHSQLNLGTRIGHDFLAMDYFTSGFGVSICGNCTIGNNVFVGTNASIREKTRICDNVIVGIGAVIISSIEQSGVYVGNPAKRIK